MEYSLTAEDYLKYYMYRSATSETQRKTRARTRYIVGIAYLALALLLFWSADHSFGAIVFGIFGLLWSGYYPYYARGKYVRHYQRFIKENLTENINRINSLEFTREMLYSRDAKSEVKISTSEIKKAVEVDDYYYLMLKSASAFIIPRSAVRNDAEFRALVNELGYNINDDKGWKWR